MVQSLVIAIGNPLRTDDGIAWRVAEELSRVPSTDVAIITVHQLTPDLAEDLSHAQSVIFVDASADLPARKLRCEKLAVTSGDAEMRFSHHMSPSALLTLALDLYNSSPQAFLVTCGGKSFEHGDSLTDEVAGALPQITAKVRELLRGN